MLLEFEKYDMKGNEFLNRLQENLQTTDRAHAARILRSTLRVLRNHLMVEESLQLISQLPMAIKGVYVDGWRAGSHKKIKSVDDLLVEIVQEEKNDAFRDFQDRNGILNAVRAVIATLREYVSDEEMDQALATLPKKILLELEGSTW
jgi:uncharacterized protein (DUF2267 family)